MTDGQEMRWRSTHTHLSSVAFCSPRSGLGYRVSRVQPQAGRQAGLGSEVSARLALPWLGYRGSVAGAVHIVQTTTTTTAFG